MSEDRGLLINGEQVNFSSKQQPTIIVVQLCVKSLDSYKALEIAETLFNTIELSFAFLLAKKGKEFSIGAFMYEFSPTEPPIIYTEGSIFGRSENKREQDQIIVPTDCFPGKKASMMTIFLMSFYLRAHNLKENSPEQLNGLEKLIAIKTDQVHY